MAGYVIRRLLAFIPLFWAVATLTFFMMHAVPGGPFDRDEGRPISEVTRKNLERKYNLDGSIAEQYVSFIGNLVQGDLGHSFSRNVPVSELIRARYRPTLELGLSAFAFSLVLGLTLGVLAAVYRNSWVDYVSVFVTTLGVAVPSFVLAVFLVIVFSLKLGWFDVIDWEFGNPRKMVLPTVSLGLLSAAYIARITRAAVLETLSEDYVRTARAKGLVERKVILGHAARNAMIPVITVLGPILAFLVTGSFVIERMFAIPGIGTLFVDSVLLRDYGVIMGTTLLFAAVIAVMNAAVDVSYAWVDPRIRY